MFWESLLVLILIAVLTLYGAEFKETDALSVSTTQSLRGVLSIIVLLHHLCAYYEMPYFLLPIKYVGYLAVAIFFFLSGYGVCYGYIYKENYLKEFGKKRIVKIIIPYYISVLIYFIIDQISGDRFGIGDIIWAMIGVEQISPLGWYICMLFILYVLFLLANLCNDKIAKILVFGILFYVIQFGCTAVNINYIWTRSIIAFPLGIIWCIKKEKFEHPIKNKYLITVVITIFFFVIGLALKLYGEIQGSAWIKLFGNIISSIFVCILVVSLLSKVKIGNKLIKYLGSISMEIYLYHRLVLDWLGKSSFLVQNVLGFAIFTMLLTIVVSIPIHNINNWCLAKMKSYN